VEFVVMAAGEGRRLRPLTERWPKPVLPIDGRPVIASLLHELTAAGARRVFVVTGHLAEQIEGLLGDGAAFGLEVRYVPQPRPEGSADAVRRAVAAGAQPPLVVSAADTLFSAGDVGRFADQFKDSGAAGAIAVRRKGARRAAPLWGVGAALEPLLGELPGPPFELLELLRRALAPGTEVVAIEIGPTRDLTYPLDLVRQNFPYLNR
jgi:NDP-sugar pyrophosphorylase family protein